MNEETKNIANEALIGFIESVQSAKDFALEQAPDVVHQLLTWKLAEACLYLTCGAIFFVTAMVAWKVFATCLRKAPHDLTPKTIASMCYGTLGSILGPCAFFDYGPTALQIWLAPKVYLLEYAADLVK